MAYNKTNWVNENEPAINADNLNKIEAGIEDNSLQLESYGRIINELNAPEKWVSVGTTAPTDGRRVWFENSANLFDGSTLESKNYVGVSSTTRVCSTQSVYLKPGTYTFSSNIDTSIYEFKTDVLVNPPTSVSTESYIYNSGFGTSSPRTITITRAGYFAILIKNKSNTDLNLATLKSFQYQLQKGSTEKTYEPYVTPSINVDGEKWIDKVNDTGWIDITSYINTSNFAVRTNDTIKVRRIGNIVYLKGEIYCKTALSNRSGNIMNGIPSIFRPTNQYSRCGVKYDLGVPYNMFISTNGNITVSESQNISVTPDYKGYQLTNLSGYIVD